MHHGETKEDQDMKYDEIEDIDSDQELEEPYPPPNMN